MAEPTDAEYLIDAYLDGELDERATRAFEAWVNASEANSAAFIRRAFNHQLLRDCFVTEGVSDLAGLAGPSTDPSSESGAFFAELLRIEERLEGDLVDLTDSIERQKREAERREHEGRPRLTASTTPVKRVIVIPRWLVYGGAAAAAVALFAAVLMLLPRNDHDRGLAKVDTPSPTRAAPAAAKPVFATLDWSDDAVWASDEPGEQLREGDTIELVSGQARLAFASSADVQIHGGTRLQITGGNNCKMSAGTLAGRVPEQARGFEVEVPGGKVRDLGTEFTISVDDNGISRVLVQTGRVDIGAVGQDGAQSTQLPLTPGLEGEIDAARGIARVRRDAELDLINTGVDRAPGERDVNWLITAINGDDGFAPIPALTPNGVGDGATVDTQWQPNTEQSRWIIQPGRGNRVPEGQVTVYRYTFPVPRGTVLDQVRIEADVWADDFLDTVRVNGTAVYDAGDPAITAVYYDKPTTLTFAEGFRHGENTIEFHVRNGTGEPNPFHHSGLRVQFKPAAIQIVQEVRTRAD